MQSPSGSNVESTHCASPTGYHSGNSDARDTAANAIETIPLPTIGSSTGGNCIGIGASSSPNRGVVEQDPELSRMAQ